MEPTNSMSVAPTKPTVSKRVPPRLSQLRADLVVSLVERGGTSVAVIKDPVAHRFFEFRRADYEFARALDSKLSLKAQVARLKETLPERCAGLEDAAIAKLAVRISTELRAHGLAAGSKAQTPKRPDSPWAVWGKRLKSISSILFFRVRLFDPSPLLEACNGMFAWCFTKRFLWLLGILCVVSGGVFVADGGFSHFEPAWFGSAASLFALYVGIVLLKFLHEAAHAVAVHHHGGSVHEVGMMLVAGLPLFYVEASDSYLFPKKSQRIAVAAAGIVLELGIAALLVWAWFLMADGFLRQLLLNLILIASVSTLLFNGNPLMRFDGYYILADALEKPDLRGDARRFFSGLLTEWILGVRQNAAHRSRRDTWILGSYGILSYLYLVIVILGIWRFLTVALDPFGLKWVAHTLVGSWALSALVFPMLGFIKGLGRGLAQSGASRKRRAVLVLGSSLLVCLAILLVPIPRWVERSCTLQPSGADIVRASEEGFVAEVLTREGAQVQAGEVLGRLENRNLENEITKIATDLAKREADLNFAIARGDTSEVGTARNGIAEARARLGALKLRRERLTLRAPVEGVVASREIWKQLGRKLKVGQVFCVVRPKQTGEFLIPLSEKEARLVRKGEKVRLRLRAFPERQYEGVIEGTPLKMKSGDLPAGLGVGSGGDVALGSSGAALGETHFATVRVADADGSLKIGMTGRVRIHCGDWTIGAAILDSLIDFVRLDFRMQ